MQLKLVDVTHIYAPKTPFETTALSNINLTIGENEFIGLIGHTGSGKSTLIQVLNGLIFPTYGKVYIDHREIREYRSLVDIRRRIGIVFQYPEDQFFEDTVFNEIAYGLKNMGLSEDVIKKRVITALSLVGLEPELFMDRSPFSLSGGEKRRLAISIILAMRPDIIVFDEPGVGLDPKSRERIFNLIHSLYRDGVSIIMVSHDMDIIASFSKRIIVMNMGEIMLDDDPYEVFVENRVLLEKIGLEIPETTRILLNLKKCGYNVNLKIFDVKGLKEQIVRILDGHI